MQPAETNRVRKGGGRTPEQQALLEEYWGSVARLREARAAFERVTDPELISACVFEIGAAQTRCSYLMGLLKEQQVTGMYVLR
ncbi:MAG: DUF2508 domain-containing protein [Clostridiaceae bacterium]|nr:DUF2508 domain-containing protein [Clostridiaceae bacterium]